LLAKREENRLFVFERKVLRMISGPKIVDSVYRSKYNFELHREFNSPYAIGVVKSDRLRYAVHMIKGAEYLLYYRELCIGPCRKTVKTKEDQNPGERIA
jgi:hypothetical protein